MSNYNKNNKKLRKKKARQREIADRRRVQKGEQALRMKRRRLQEEFMRTRNSPGPGRAQGHMTSTAPNILRTPAETEALLDAMGDEDGLEHMVPESVPPVSLGHMANPSRPQDGTGVPIRFPEPWQQDEHEIRLTGKPKTWAKDH